MTPNIVDIIVLVIIVLGAIQGLLRGLSGELARLISTVIVFILGVSCYRPVGLLLASHTRLSAAAAGAVAFSIVAATAIILMVLLRYVLKKLMKVVFVPWFDKVGGCVAGMLRASIFVMIIIIVMNMVPNEYVNEQCGEKSIIGTGVLKVMPRIREELDDTTLSDVLPNQSEGEEEQ